MFLPAFYKKLTVTATAFGGKMENTRGRPREFTGLGKFCLGLRTKTDEIAANANEKRFIQPTDWMPIMWTCLGFPLNVTGNEAVRTKLLLCSDGLHGDLLHVASDVVLRASTERNMEMYIFAFPDFFSHLICWYPTSNVCLPKFMALSTQELS